SEVPQSGPNLIHPDRSHYGLLEPEAPRRPAARSRSLSASSDVALYANRGNQGHGRTQSAGTRTGTGDLTMTALQEVRTVKTRAETAKVITVLAVSPFEEDHARLREIFRHSRWKLYSALTWREALQVEELVDVSLVICE